MVNLFLGALELDVVGTLWAILICHPVSAFGKSSGYVKGSNDESKTEIFLMVSLTFVNEIIFHS